MWDYSKITQRDMSSISRQFPKEMLSPFPAKCKWFHWRQLCSKFLICWDDTNVAFCLPFAVRHKASDKTVPVIVPPVLQCQAKSFLHLSRPELLFEEDGEREHVCCWAERLLTTALWQAVALICSAHMDFIKPIIGIVRLFYVTVALFQLFAVTVTVGAWCLDNLHSTNC